MSIDSKISISFLKKVVSSLYYPHFTDEKTQPPKEHRTNAKAPLELKPVRSAKSVFSVSSRAEGMLSQNPSEESQQQVGVD